MLAFRIWELKRIFKFCTSLRKSCVCSGGWNVENAKSIIAIDRGIITGMLAVQLAVSKEKAKFILKEDLKKRKIFSRFGHIHWQKSITREPNFSIKTDLFPRTSILFALFGTFRLFCNFFLNWVWLKRETLNSVTLNTSYLLWLTDKRKCNQEIQRSFNNLYDLYNCCVEVHKDYCEAMKPWSRKKFLVCNAGGLTTYLTHYVYLNFKYWKFQGPNIL